jgi:mRNA-degrading endonuclease toxin of MazEF toxin-antitoxin module
MQKTPELYDAWNTAKKSIEITEVSKITLIGEIWFAKIWINIGHESSKDGDFERPVIIASSHLGGDLICVFPCSSVPHASLKEYELPVQNARRYGFSRDTYILLNQIQTISTKRLTRKLNQKRVKGTYIPLIPKNFIRKLFFLLMKICLWDK